MNASQLRQKAWNSLKGNYWPAVAAAFVAAIFGALIVNSGSLSLDFGGETRGFLRDLPFLVRMLLGVFVGALSVFSLVQFVLGGVVQLGYARYLLKQQDRESNSVKDLFSQFDRFKEGFLQSFLRFLYIFLWSLLLVIPGIIKALGYSMTPFLMAEYPNLSAKEAMRISQEKMQGHKWELFCLGFSFIGWVFLVALTGGIGGFFLAPYMNAAYAAFYRDKISHKTPIISYTYIDEQN